MICLLFACSEEPLAPNTDSGQARADASRVELDGGGPSDLGEDGDAAVSADSEAPDAGPNCEDPPARPERSCGTLSWSDGEFPTRPRNHHVSALVHTPGGPYLLSIGGVNGHAPIANVDVARVREDGSPGPWVGTQSLPNSTGGGAIGVVANVIVVSGGMTPSGVTDLSYAAAVLEDGTLEPWTPAGSTLHRRMHPGGFARDGHVYVLGGFHDLEVWDDVVRAQVAVDGSVSTWAPAGSLPGPRSHFAITAIEDYVYLSGGLEESAYTNPPFLSEVVRAEIGADGTLGNWTNMPPLPVALATHASFSYGGHLYVGGGISADGQERRIWRAPILEDRSLGPWEEAPPLLVARGHLHQLPVFRNRVYAIGGAVDYDLNSTDRVDIGTFE